MYRKKCSLSNPPFVDGKHNMSCFELCDADDLATMMTVDAVFGFTTHKMAKNYKPLLIDKNIRKQWGKTLVDFMTDLNYENAYSKLIASDKIKTHFKKDERFKLHIYRFLYLFDKRSGIQIKPCDRYENEDRRGAAIFATKRWETGSRISTLFGCIAEMNSVEEEIFRESKNEFSVMFSTRKNCSQLWLGPAAYVNHDCKPNCRFTEGNEDSKMTLETLRDIHPGDELLIYYGSNFFGTGNTECECFTCELRNDGLFHSRNLQNRISLKSLPSSSVPDMSRLRSNSSRSSKKMSTDHGDIDDQVPFSTPHYIRGRFDKLSFVGDAYPFRITYSRIDREKKRIISEKSNHSSTESLKSTTTSIKSKRPLILRQKSDLFSKPKIPESDVIVRRRSQRNINCQSTSTQEDVEVFKLKLRSSSIKSTKFAKNKATLLSKPTLDSNLFDIMTELYLSQSENRSPANQSTSARVKVDLAKKTPTEVHSANHLKIAKCCENLSEECTHIAHHPAVSSARFPRESLKSAASKLSDKVLPKLGVQRKVKDKGIL